MRYIDKAKPIKFSLLVGGKECRNIEDVKHAFNVDDEDIAPVFKSLWESFINGNLKKWLMQIQSADYLGKMDNHVFCENDDLKRKLFLFNLFAAKPLPFDEVCNESVLSMLSMRIIKITELNETDYITESDVLSMLRKGIIESSDLQGSIHANIYEEKKSSISFIWSMMCITNQGVSKDLDLLMQFNDKTIRTLIDGKKVTDKKVILSISIKRGFDDYINSIYPPQKTIFVDCYSSILSFVSFELKMIRVIDAVKQECFYIGETPVTIGLWKKVIGHTNDLYSWHVKGDDCPVCDVTWNMINDIFLPKLNILTSKCFRLPTDEEWECAARGGHKSKGYIYSGSNNINDVAWYNESYDSGPHPVKQKLPNELGLYDMSGNVWEWCQDWYDEKKQKRVLRGGGWSYSDFNCEVSYKYGSEPDSSTCWGFRLALCID